MPNTIRKKHLWDTYRFPGFTPARTLEGVFGDRMARVVRLSRRSKKLLVGFVAAFDVDGTTRGLAEFAIFPAAITESSWSWSSDASSVGSAVV